MNKINLGLGACLLSILSFGCGDDSPAGNECGEGTTEVDGVCVSNGDSEDTTAPITSINEEGSRSRDLPDQLFLITNEPATIYYTTDGSEPTTSSDSGQILVVLPELESGTELKYFAVDTAGNTEAVQSQTYVLDRLGPAAPTDFTVTEETDGTVTLSWTNPTDADFDGVVIMREGLSTALASGTAADASEVLFVGAGTSTTDDPGEGYFNYSILSFDDLLNYGGGATTSYDNPSVVIGSTGWAFHSDGTITTGATPTGVGINVTFDTGATFIVSLTNNTATETFHAPKALFTNIVDGTWGDGTVDSETFVRVGDNGISLAPGETLTGSFTVVFTGVDNGAGLFTATADIGLRNDPILIAGNDRDDSNVLMIVDEGTFTQIGGMDADTHIPDGSGSGYNGMRGLASRQGSRFIWAGNRSKGAVRKIDTATWSTVAVANIGNDRNLANNTQFGSDGLLWTALSTGGPGYIGTSSSSNGTGENFLVAVQADTMTEVRRIPVSTGGRLRQMVQIPGTAKFVVANHRGGALFIVDTSLADEDATTTILDDDIAPSRSVTVSADGSTAYLAVQNDSYHGGTEGDATIVNLNTGDVTALPAHFQNSVQVSGLDPVSGKIWFGSSNILEIMDPADANSVLVVGGFDAEQLLIGDGVVYASDSSTVREIDPSDQAILRSAALSSGIEGHTLHLVP